MSEIKPLLRQMIDNNKPHWRPATILGAHKQLDEYEAKAKAFDEIFKLYIGYEDGWINFPRGRMSFNKEIINVCKSYESGEPNA